MTIYLDLVDFVETAAELLDLPEETVVKMTRLDLAESALHAPQAGWGEVEFYPDFAMKAAVLLVRLAKNHYVPPVGDPDGEETFQRMRAVAGASAEDLEAVEADVAGWIAERLHPRPADG